MLKILYDPDHGTPIPDGVCEDQVKEDYKKGRNVSTSTENYVLAARVLIAEKKISWRRVKFYFGIRRDEELREVRCESNGMFKDWSAYPNSFPITFVRRLLQAQPRPSAIEKFIETENKKKNKP